MLFTNGNLKLGKDTLIFNMYPATFCASRMLGMCQLEDPSTCYALKAEKMYPNVLPFRVRQAKSWAFKDDKSFVQSLVAELERKRKVPIKYVRFNESGDFATQDDINKLIEICERVQYLPDPHRNVVFYGYTARKDLDYSCIPDNLVVNGSGWCYGDMNMFDVVEEFTEGLLHCPADCRTCDLCKSNGSRYIEVKMH